MPLDAIIISDSGVKTMSGTNPLKLLLDGRIADVQVVLNYLKHQGKVLAPIEGDGVSSWASAPKLNGISLLHYLTSQKFEVELIDSYYEEQEEFRRLLKDTPRAVIISTTYIPNKPTLKKLVDDIRELAPDIFIIVGGPLIYLSYLMLQRSSENNYDTESAKNDFLFLNVNDEPSANLYIISLLGEKILCEALRNLKEGKPINRLPNSATLLGKKYNFFQRMDEISEPADFFIDWKLLPGKIFKSKVIPMQASNGCPYQCAFCNFAKDRKLTFVKPLDQLVNELKAVAIRGVRHVWFVDDNFRLGKDDLNNVCRRIIAEGIEIEWMTFVRAGALNNVDMQLLRRAGCIEVQLGLESADTMILKNMNKKASPQQYSEVLRLLLSTGINCSCYFISGFPGETDETAQKTREFIKRHEYPELEGYLSWSLYPFVLSPLSPIYEPDMRKEYKLTGYMQKWKHRTMDSDRAREHVLKTFLGLQNSGPIYRGDNLSILKSLGPRQRKKFEAIRHSLSKAAWTGLLERQRIMESFKQIFPSHDN
ncbi:MAG: radical SAM protein [Deltaproteobacteria bacterium]|nr:MAG: radical SAM protein [Deltaproteobacteria bacterium]